MEATRLRLALLTCATVPLLAACNRKVDEHVPHPAISTPRIPANLSRKPPSQPPVRPQAEASKEIGPDGGRLELAGARIELPSGALARATKLQIQRVLDESLPALSPGMINVTDGGGGYRFLPEGQRFAKKVSVTLPIRSPGKGHGNEYWAALGVHTYFWSSALNRWQALEGNFTGTENRLTSSTEHFTLMINAIVQAPEHAGPANFNENAISSIGAGDPAANVDLIQPPDANNEGDARLTFPIRLPKGRGAFSPELVLNYSSANGSGPIGVGWDLHVSKISVDTRLGVPSYSGSERYLLDGATLIPIGTPTNASCRRTVGGAVTLVHAFAARTHRDQLVLMCRGGGGRYWEVTGKNGVRSDYGVDSAHRLEPAGGDESRAATWFVQEVEDPNGNVTAYTYDRRGEDAVSEVAGQPYLSTVDYTSHRTQTLPPAYKVELGWNNCNDVHDTVSSARNGYLTRVSCRLRSIDVKARQPSTGAYAAVRHYNFDYTPSTFDNKDLLTEILVKGSGNSDFYAHTFDYTNPELGAIPDIPVAFGPVDTWTPAAATDPGQLAQSSWLLDFSNEENYQVNFSGGVSVNWGAGNGASVGCTLGGSTGISLECPTPELRLMDVNGDSVADRVWISSSGEVRAALAKRDQQRPHVAGVSLIESQVALGGSQSFDASCSLGAASVNSGLSFSLRLSASGTQMLDADGDGRVDLLAGDSFYKGLPNVCRDGTVPALCVDGSTPNSSGNCAGRSVLGLCSDGLRACRDQATLCFDAPTSLSGLSPSGSATIMLASTSAPTNTRSGAPATIHQPEAPRTRHAAASETRISSVANPGHARERTVAVARERRVPAAREPRARVANARSEEQPALAVRSAHPVVDGASEPESSWGPYTSARRRMEKENTSDYVAAPFTPVRPVIRWDAPIKGKVAVNVRARRLHKGGQDGVQLTLLRVKDFHTDAGTEQLSQITLGPTSTAWGLLARDSNIELEFGDSLLVVYDTLADSPVTETGKLLDEVQSEIYIRYREVCPLGDTCRELTDAERYHHNATGELAYAFRYPDDMRTSELPRELYWQLLPPLGAPFKHPTLDRMISSMVTLQVEKKLTTDTPVHIRVRCESIGSKQARDQHTCPVGTILRDFTLSKDEITSTRTTVPVPAPFVSSAALVPKNPDCIFYDHNNLLVRNVGDLGWRLEDADDTWMALYGSQADGDAAAALAKGYTRQCFFGRRNEGEPVPEYVHDYFAFPVGALGGSSSAAPTPASEDCIDYRPGALEIVDATNGKWLLKADGVRLGVFDSREVAEQAKSVGQYYGRQCYVGRGNIRESSVVWRRHRDYVSGYYGKPLEQVLDPTRILVEVDGENGVEIPPTAVKVDAKLVVHALRDVSSVEVGQAVVDGTTRPLQMVVGTSDVQSFWPDKQPRVPLRTLHRVHPARDLRAFHTKRANEEVLVRATLVRPRHPLHLGITGDGIEGALWSEVVRDIPSGQLAVTKEYRTTIPAVGLYYLRGYTEASFDPEASVRVQAWITAPEEKDWIELPVNLLRADFGSSYYADWYFPRVVGEVPHSFDPYAGGHHAFFYGLYKGPNLRCLGPYACGTHPPARMHVAINASTAWSGPSIRPPERLMNPALRQVKKAQHVQIKALSAAPAPSTPTSAEASTSAAKDEDSGIAGCVGTRAYCCVKHLPLGDCDGDGIRNEIDACVLEPETFNEMEDADGCPDECSQDSDEDGVADCVDACPYEPQNFDGYPGQANGCSGVLPGPTEPNNDGRPTTTTGPSGEDCFTGAGFSSWICGTGSGGGDPDGPGGGTVHPTNENSNGGAGHGQDSLASSGCDPTEVDGFRRTWVFGLSISSGASVTLGNSSIGLGASYTVGIGAQYTDRDVLDWNGDGIIDRASANIITLGARNDTIHLVDDCYIPGPGGCLVNPGVRESASASLGFNLSGSGSGRKTIRTTPEGEIKDQATESVSFGLGAYLSYSATLSQRMDLNGDGLPDQVVGSDDRDLTVRTNLGRKLAGAATREVKSDLPSGGSTFVSDVSDYLLGKVGRKPIATSDSFTRSDSIGGGGGVSIGVFGGSVSASRANSRTLTQTARDFADINGDGLADIVIKAADQSTLSIAFNMGDFFAEPKPVLVGNFPKINGGTYTSGLDSVFTKVVFGETDPVGAMGSDTTTWAGSTEATVFFIKGGASFAYTEGGSTTQLVLRDVDGDGIPDRVLRTGAEDGGAIKVARGLFGHANLLSAVHRPFGGTISLEYARNAPTEEAPRAKWNLSKVKLEQSDPARIALCGTTDATACGLPPVETTFSYSGGYYDRYEKESFGYRTVNATRTGDGRIIEREYNNRDYWLKGSLLAERVRSGGTLLSENLSVYEAPVRFGSTNPNRSSCLGQLIVPQKYLDTSQLRVAERTPCDVRAPRLSRTERRFHEGAEVPVTASQDVTYDANGNPETVTERDGGANAPTVFASIEYDDRAALLDKHILDRAESIVIRTDDVSGSLQRKRKAVYDDRGNLKRHEVWSQDSATGAASLDLVTDAFGFVTSITDANSYGITFVPDDVTHGFPKETRDTFGLVASATYDFGFQQIFTSTDPNGNVIEHTYDEFGRLETVRGPNERTANMDSVHVEYSSLVDGTYPERALTTNTAVDPDGIAIATTLHVARFVDGLAREVQSQSEADVASQGASGLEVKHGRVLSGRIAFDSSGRRPVLGEPVFATGTNFAYETIAWETTTCTTTGPVYCTKTQYDAFDRPTVVTAPGGITTTNAFALAAHPRDATRTVRQTEITDPEGKIRRLFHDATDRLVAVVEVLDGRELKTTYDYSQVGDLVSIQDARDKVRTFEYDLAGRRTAIVTPDTGRLEMAYDSMGNPVSQTDQELCTAAPPLLKAAACSSKVIQRTYDKNRMVSVDYPSTTTSPDVELVYGDKDPLNRCSGSTNVKGRACWIHDVAGTEKRSFGYLGDIVRQERTLPVFNSSTATSTYATAFRRDSFGRLLRIDYPDGERVTYAYDNGGRVAATQGKRGTVVTDYLDGRAYDLYGKLISNTFGNGVVEQSEYQQDTQRLKKRAIYRGSTLISSTELADYDKSGNVKSSVTLRNEGHDVTRLERSYAYDDLHRLDTFAVTGKQSGGTAALSVGGNYDYDDVGNITRQALVGTGGAALLSRDWSYVYSSSARPNLPDTVGPQTWGYDRRGSARSFSGGSDDAALDWNDEGQLSSIGRAGTQSTFRYGADAARLWRQADNASSTEVVHYPSPYYTAEYRRTRPSGCGDDSCAILTATRTKQIRIDGSTIASVVGIVDPSSSGSESAVSYLSVAPNYLHGDQIRSTTVVTATGGGVGRVYEYLPFGELVPNASTVETSDGVSFVSFNGMERDALTSLDYFGARYFLSWLGRWLSPDPRFQNPTASRDLNPPDLNLNAFARNSPLRFREMGGLSGADVLGDYASFDEFSSAFGKYVDLPYAHGWIAGGPYSGTPGSLKNGGLDCTSLQNASLAQFLTGTIRGQRNISGMTASDLFRSFGGVQVKTGVGVKDLAKGLDPNKIYGVDRSGEHAFVIRNLNGKWVSYESTSTTENSGVKIYSWESVEARGKNETYNVFDLGDPTERVNRPDDEPPPPPPPPPRAETSDPDFPEATTPGQ